MPADEEHTRPRCGHGVDLRERIDIHAVGKDQIRTTERGFGHRPRVGTHGDPDRELTRGTHRELAEGLVRRGARLPRGVEGSDLGNLTPEERGARRTGHKWFVQVQHVGLEHA